MEREQRRFTRVSFNTRAEITKGTISITGDVKDLSLKGMFVISKEKFPVGQSVDINIELTGSKHPLNVSVRGHIVRITPEGMGIDFDRMDLDSFTVLKEIVSHNFGNSDKIKREIIHYLTKTNANPE